MEMNNLPGLVLLLVSVGLLVGVGVLSLDKFGTAIKDTATADNETIVITSGTGSTTNDEVSAVTFFGNSSNSTTGSNNVHFNFTSGGAITVNTTKYPDATYNIYYTYLSDSVGATTAAAGRDAVGEVSTTWMGLIVTIMILSIIIGLIIGGFSMYRKR